MKTALLLALLSSTLMAHAFRSAPGQQSGNFTVSLNGSRQCVVTQNSYVITTPQNSQLSGLSICRMAGLMYYESHTALPGGTYRNTAADVDPATAPCRLEGAISGSFTNYTCGVDP